MVLGDGYGAKEAVTKDRVAKALCWQLRHAAIRSQR
jgi:hypothetical protein